MIVLALIVPIMATGAATFLAFWFTGRDSPAPAPVAQKWKIEQLEQWHAKYEKGIDPDHICTDSTELVYSVNYQGYALRACKLCRSVIVDPEGKPIRVYYREMQR